jgi:type II secretory pathway pseudopilin PulG
MVGAGRTFRRGFTIIEVMLFLVVSSALLISILAGTGTTIARHRYDDSVKGFHDALQAQYSYMSSIQNAVSVDGKGNCKTNVNGINFNPSEDNSSGGRGRSDCLIYGRLIEFGDTSDKLFDDGKKYKVTTMIGADLTGLEISNNDLNYYRKLSELDDLGLLKLANLIRLGDGEEYKLLWDSNITDRNGRTDYAAAVLIVRAPLSSTIRTFIVDTTKADDREANDIDVNKSIITEINGSGTTTNPFDSIFADKYLAQGLDFCVHPAGLPVIGGAFGGAAKLIRLTPNGSNASSVDILMTDEETEDNRCR